MKKLINVAIDIGAALLIIGIIAFFLIGGPKGGNPEEKTTVATTVETTIATTEKTVTTKEPTKEATTVVTTEVTTETTNEATTKKAELNVRAASGSKKNKYSQEDVYLLAQILEAEAGGEGRAEMARVCQVVLNRVDSKIPDFKSVNTIYEVLSQPGQYTTTFRRIRGGLVPSEAALEVAKGMVNGTVDSGLPEGPDGVLWQCQDYPTWDARVVYTYKLQGSKGYHYYAVYDPC